MLRSSSRRFAAILNGRELYLLYTTTITRIAVGVRNDDDFELLLLLNLLFVIRELPALLPNATIRIVKRYRFVRVQHLKRDKEVTVRLREGTYLHVALSLMWNACCWADKAATNWCDLSNKVPCCRGRRRRTLRLQHLMDHLNLIAAASEFLLLQMDVLWWCSR